MEIGNIVGTEKKLFIPDSAANESIIVTGAPGYGKTDAVKKISKEIAKSGHNVLVCNYHSTHNDILYDKEAYHVISAKRDGIPVPFLERFTYPDGSREDAEDIAEAVAEVFSQVGKMGYAAKYQMIQAVQQAVKMRDGYGDDMTCLLAAVMMEEEKNEVLLAKYKNLMMRVKFLKKYDLWRKGMVTVIDFSGCPSAVQISLTQLILSAIWRRYQIFGQTQQEKTFLVLDEFQNLPFKNGSILSQILREGRKFKLFLLLATQTIYTYDTESRIVLQQPGTKLYFRPVDTEIKRIAKSFTDIEAKMAENLLKGLGIGECLATGEFEIAGTSRMRTLKVTFREKE